MKHTLEFLYKVCLICLVAVVVFVLPAAMSTLVWLDKSVYFNMIKNPIYCGIMIIVTIFMVCVFVDYMIAKSKSNANTSE